MEHYAGACILNNDKILLVQNAHKKAQGQWSLPAGRVELDETLEEATVRETREETGFTIKIIRRIATYSYTDPEYEYHIFLAEIVGGEITFDPEEIMNVRWMNAEEIKNVILRPSNSFIPELLNSLKAT